MLVCSFHFIKTNLVFNVNKILDDDYGNIVIYNIPHNRSQILMSKTNHSFI